MKIGEVLPAIMQRESRCLKTGALIAKGESCWWVTGIGIFKEKPTVEDLEGIEKGEFAWPTTDFKTYTPVETRLTSQPALCAKTGETISVGQSCWWVKRVGLFLAEPSAEDIRLALENREKLKTSS